MNRNLLASTVSQPPAVREGSRGSIVLGVAASDAHVVANHLIAMLLRKQGFRVVNLGACTPTEDFMKAAADNADDLVAVVIGSLNGHALEDLADLPAQRQRHRVTAPIVLGGNLSVGAVKDSRIEERLTALGVDCVLRHPGQLVDALRSLGWHDPVLLPFERPAVPALALQALHAQELAHA
ncbi:MAG: cobalamin-dependent protein [Rubrivivax sp.]|nr:cobalamin-dependent protein [Rubrivivax sp.]